jgi:hypothetical protein
MFVWVEVRRRGKYQSLVFVRITESASNIMRRQNIEKRKKKSLHSSCFDLLHADPSLAMLESDEERRMYLYRGNERRKKLAEWYFFVLQANHRALLSNIHRPAVHSSCFVEPKGMKNLGEKVTKKVIWRYCVRDEKHENLEKEDHAIVGGFGYAQNNRESEFRKFPPRSTRPPPPHQPRQGSQSPPANKSVSYLHPRSRHQKENLPRSSRE